MDRDQLQETRAARAREGSQRQRDLDAAGMRAQRIAARLAAERRTIDNHERARDWARKAFPSSAAEVWLDLIAVAAGTIRKRTGKDPTRATVIDRLRANGHPVDGADGIPALVDEDAD